MRKIILVLAALTAASFLLIACDPAGNANAPRNTAANNSATNSPANSATSSASAEADVKKLVSDLSAALSKNDTAALDKIYADDYTLVTQTGDVATKAERVGAIKSGALKFENVAFNDVRVRNYGDTAVAIANSTGRSTSDGKTQDTRYRVTFIANKTKDGWRLVGAHLSPLPEAAKPDDAAKKDESNKTPASNTNANK